MSKKIKYAFLFASISLWLANASVNAQKNVYDENTAYFEGEWRCETDKYNFTVSIIQHGDTLRGTYCVASAKWADCWDSGADYCVIEGVIRHNKAIIIFNSNFSPGNSKDTAIIFYNKTKGTLLWDRKTHTIESHVPNKAILWKDILIRN